MASNKFVIGIGSQRAGSTLLHKILDQCTEVFMHPVKELHYFDTLYSIRKQEVLTLYSQNRLEALAGFTATTKKEKCEVRTNQILSTRKVQNVDYLDLYRPCLMGNASIGEITPEYMILPDEGIKMMAETVGADAKIILITRDPVQRFISSFKLLKAYNTAAPDFSTFEHDILEVFDTMPGWVTQQKALNDYQKCEHQYRKYFTEMLVLSYEKLTTDYQSELSRIEDLLQEKIDQTKIEQILGKKVNQLTKIDELTTGTVKRIEKALL